MNTLQYILLAVVVLLGYPIGKFIASKTKEELKGGKKWFKIIMITSVIGAVIGIILSEILLISSFAFIFLIALASLK